MSSDRRVLALTYGRVYPLTIKAMRKSVVCYGLRHYILRRYNPSGPTGLVLVIDGEESERGISRWIVCQLGVDTDGSHAVRFGLILGAKARIYSFGSILQLHASNTRNIMECLLGKWI